MREGWCPPPTGRRGVPFRYSDVAIQTLPTVKGLLRLPYRMVEGFGRSRVAIRGVDQPFPDHIQLSRWAKTLMVRIPRRAATSPRHFALDAAGVKIIGEGEWKVRQYGASKRRTWRKLHLSVDTHGMEILAVEVKISIAHR